MTDAPKPSEKALREQRLQAALRENLKRRKAHARAGGGEARAEPHDFRRIIAERSNLA
jgi:hypothetical protein